MFSGDCSGKPLSGSSAGECIAGPNGFAPAPAGAVPPVRGCAAVFVL
jgi:hypothetical protein